jgi:type II secretory pathway component PulM
MIITIPTVVMLVITIAVLAIFNWYIWTPTRERHERVAKSRLTTSEADPRPIDQAA